jgi:sulfonate transport system ATP-binding protein
MSHHPLVAEHLTCAHGARIILEDLSLTVRQGEIVAVIGASGVGKSTLLHTLAGHLPTSAGHLQRTTELGMIFQQKNLFPWLTAEENVAFGLAVETSQRRSVVQHALTLAQLTHRARAYPHELSGGECQRVAIARTLTRQPQLLLMDEPFGALDALTRITMQDWLLAAWQQAKPAIVLITHDLQEALFLADRILVLGHKRITHVFDMSYPRQRQATGSAGVYDRVLRAVSDNQRQAHAS